MDEILKSKKKMMSSINKICKLKRKTDPIIVYEAIYKGLHGEADFNRDIDNKNPFVELGKNLKEKILFTTSQRDLKEFLEIALMFSKMELEYVRIKQINKMISSEEIKDVTTVLQENQLIVEALNNE